MKLSSRYSRVNLLTSFIILLITGIAYYLVIHYILTQQLDKDLAVEEQEIAAYAKLYHSLPPEGNFKDQLVRYKKGVHIVSRRFSDTRYDNLKDHEEEPGRSLTTAVSLGNKSVQVEIVKSKVESEDLIRIIFLITLAIIVLLLCSLVLINRFILNRLWKPFHITLSELQVFNISDNRQIEPEETVIDEFREFNEAAIALTCRVRKDYSDLKSITDNASHEMMTPLAVIQSKLDSLLQTGDFNDQQGILLDDIYQGMNRLFRLNQSFLLLSKIENRLILEKDTICLRQLILQKCNQFQELIQADKITVSLVLVEKEILMSKYLADILLNNLISNSIRHNRTGGKISILLNAEGLEIANTGKAEKLDAEKIFDRFNKDSSSEGIGLGLAISKEICHYYGYSLTYRYNEEEHFFSAGF
jgi:signal transduction histidine kinase